MLAIKIYFHLRFILAPILKRKLIKNPPSEEWLQAYLNLRDNGYVKLPSLLSESEYKLLTKINDLKKFKMLSKSEFPYMTFSDEIKINSNLYGIEERRINSNSKILQKKKYWEKLEWLIECYLGHSRFWIRNGPMLLSDIKDLKYKKHPSNYYHIDFGMHQLGFTMLLNKTNYNSTCTELIPKTNKNFRPQAEFYKLRMQKKFMSYAKNEEKEKGTVKLYGEIGSTFIFDAGNMLHKGVPGSNRLMFQINFTSFASNKNELDKKLNKYNSIGKKSSVIFSESN
ncbi:hypothetical protein [Prochlorococcus marinus]|uniref:hypothetical protein n=1 Tax=Prochlorococcus marinus TaxID=1219 RepID=UPI001ADD01A1|nr:hypothetical protein [Prochlorococcus marinus]MBO8221438.1 hypothetical protein [Prochlorococcus marinus CUG1417]